MGVTAYCCAWQRSRPITFAFNAKQTSSRVCQRCASCCTDSQRETRSTGLRTRRLSCTSGRSWEQGHELGHLTVGRPRGCCSCQKLACKLFCLDVVVCVYVLLGASPNQNPRHPCTRTQLSIRTRDLDASRRAWAPTHPPARNLVHTQKRAACDYTHANVGKCMCLGLRHSAIDDSSMATPTRVPLQVISRHIHQNRQTDTCPPCPPPKQTGRHLATRPHTAYQ